MEAFLQILFSGLTLGAMYALSAVGLTLLWGVVGMLNMSQGVMLAIGGYASYSAITYLGLPWPLGLPAAIVAGFITGLVFYHVMVRWMYRAPAFEVNIIIATVGAAIVLESLMIRVFTGYPLDQPFSLPGGFRIGGIQLPYQTLINLAVAGTMTLGLGWLLRSTRLGRAIRATAQRRDAAQLLGVPGRQGLSPGHDHGGYHRRHLRRHADRVRRQFVPLCGDQPHAQGLLHLRDRGPR